MSIKYNYTKNPLLKTSLNIGSPKEFDVDGHLIKNNKIFSALDLNWHGANIGDSSIDSTDDLLELIDDMYNNKSSITGVNPSDIDSASIRILLSAIRALQSEVVKIRNTFRFGINSYTDTQFHMSQTVNEIGTDVIENEPLWATEESDLSYIDGLDTQEYILEFFNDQEYYIDSNTGFISYENELTWCEDKDIIKDLTDPKFYMYLTTSTNEVQIKLTDHQDEPHIYTINISNLCNKVEQRKYNILLIVSKKVDKKGNNFIWLSISDYSSGESVINGYVTFDDFIGSINSVNPNSPVYQDDILYLDSVIFSNDSEKDYIYKFDLYSKFQDFTEEVEGTTPKDPEEFKYTTASLTIRSMKSYDLIDAHKNQLQNNELIYCEGNKKLYIYSNGKIINIGSSSGSSDDINDNMTAQEIMQALSELGYINLTFIDENADDKFAPENIAEYKVNNVALDSVKFINQDTEKVFDITIDPYGNFKSSEELTESLEKILNSKSGGTESYLDDLPGDFEWDRTFVGLLNSTRFGKDKTKDMGLYGDRIQIGAVYAPLDTDKIYGCTHGYIELINSGKDPFYLDGCYLHYSASIDGTIDNVNYYKLPLKGYIPAGGTYLVRCKQYSDISNKNTFIDVNTYDIEWYDNKELLDLTINANGSYNFALTYGDEVNGQKITATTQLTQKTETPASGGTKTSAHTYVKGYIDSICIGKKLNNNTIWVGSGEKGGQFDIISNCIYKLTFELDPAKQAFTSTTTKDSSRIRWQNKATDYQNVILDNEYISFPKSDERKAVKDYTPLASYMGKNVITDKSTLSKDHPNAIVCSYGINPYTTRCFNWLSLGLFNEAVVIIDNNKEYIFESYTKKGTNDKQLKEQSNTFPHRHEFSDYVNDVVYTTSPVSQSTSRITGFFPGNNDFYTSHKCIIDVTNEELTEPKTYQYYIARLDSAGRIDESYKSDMRSFTIYPKSYQPRIYQVTDQQGFHWIEYQVWAASANELNNLINKECESSNIMPIIVNTGDAVQSGARVNEWVDYFNAGDYLFNHYEQMNIVGNNDLCDTDPSILGTGDDTGKSNGYFFHLFNCYEVNEDEYTPICNDIYIPSLYYIDVVSDIENENDSQKYTKLIFVNSEITAINCRDWFNLGVSSDVVINIYTGWTCGINNSVANNQQYLGKDNNFVPIYNILYNWTNDNKNYVTFCHEMPFTVITNACLNWGDNGTQKSRFRSYSDAANQALIGSHLNQLTKVDDGKGIHWFSRLLEYRGIKLCIGGHKHTYACTYPIRENYIYDNDKTSLYDGTMNMGETLENDTAIWMTTYVDNNNETHNINLSKLPIVIRPQEHIDLDGGTNNQTINLPNDKSFTIQVNTQADGAERILFIPIVDDINEYSYNHTIYLMCQATGYKLTSNKELPSAYQKFAMVLPKTTIKDGADSPSSDQRVPMFSITNILPNNSYELKIGRFDNIFKGNNFTQSAYSTANIDTQYIVQTNINTNGCWCKTSNNNIVSTNKDGSSISAGTVLNEQLLYPITDNNLYMYKIN